MTQQVIDVGNVANDGQGDPLRTAFIKTNDNFTELYNIGGISGIANAIWDYYTVTLFLPVETSQWVDCTLATEANSQALYPVPRQR